MPLALKDGRWTEASEDGECLEKKKNRAIPKITLTSFEHPVYSRRHSVAHTPGRRKSIFEAVAEDGWRRGILDMFEVEQEKQEEEEDEEDEEECARSVHFREGQWLGQWLEEDKQEEDSDTEISASLVSLAILNSSVFGLHSLVTVCFPVKTSFNYLHFIYSGS